jgi:hypothetical protein
MQGARHAVQNPGAAYAKGLATAVALPGAPDAFNPQTDAALGLSALLLRMERSSDLTPSVTFASRAKHAPVPREPTHHSLAKRRRDSGRPMGLQVLARAQAGS